MPSRGVLDRSAAYYYVVSAEYYGSFRITALYLVVFDVVFSYISGRWFPFVSGSVQENRFRSCMMPSSDSLVSHISGRWFESNSVCVSYFQSDLEKFIPTHIVVHRSHAIFLST